MSYKPIPKHSKRKVAPRRPTPKPKLYRICKVVAPILPDQVDLVSTKGTKNRGGGLNGHAWRIEVNGKRAGVVFINYIDESPVGEHASIQIYLNKSSQGRHIGRIAYYSACQASNYDVIYAHMSKSNIASKRAAEEAGFKEEKKFNYSQRLMVWHREST